MLKCFSCSVKILKILLSASETWIYPASVVCCKGRSPASRTTLVHPASSQGHWSFPPCSLLGLMRHLSTPKKRGNLQSKKTENTAHEDGTDVAHPSLGNLTESPEGSCWDSAGTPCRTEEGQLCHTVYKGKSFKWPLKKPWIHQGTTWFNPKENVKDG